MKIIYKRRGAGKSAELIKRSAETGAYIMVANEERRKNLCQMARNLGYASMPYPVTVWEYRQNSLRGLYNRHILIDDADDVLKTIFYEVEIDAITMTKNKERKSMSRKDKIKLIVSIAVSVLCIAFYICMFAAYGGKPVDEVPTWVHWIMMGR